MLDRQLEAGFPRGMFWGTDPSQIPVGAAHDIVGFVGEGGRAVRRGGSSYASAGAVTGGTVYGIWTGTLAAGSPFLIFTSTGVKLLSGTTITTLTATVPSNSRPAVLNGVLYWDRSSYDGTTFTPTALSAMAGTGPYSQAVVAGRLIRARDGRIDFSGVLTTTFGATDYHVLPRGAVVKGMRELRNAVALFSTGGIYILSGLENALTDGAGNVQQRMDLYSDDVVLASSDWSVVNFGSGMIVPALDGVWSVSLGVTSEAALPLERISAPIDALYRLGSPQGEAMIVEGTYFLPFLIGATSMVLACRLDSRYRPWSRLAGQGAQVQALHRDAAGFQYGCGGNSARLLFVAYLGSAATFGPGGDDADGTTPDLLVTLRDIALGPLQRNTLAKVRVGYEISDGTVQVLWMMDPTHDYAIGSPAFGMETAPGAGAAPAQSHMFLPRRTVLMGIGGRFVRLQVLVSGADSASVATVEMFTRSSGRQ